MASESGGPSNPLSDAEFVLYWTSEEHVDYEPSTDWGQELGLAGVSLWARWADDRIEFPLFSAYEQGVWHSLDPDMSENAADETVSEAFLDAVARLPDEDANGWMGIEEEVWEDLSDPECFMVGQFRQSFIGDDVLEPCGAVFAVIHERHAADGGEDGE